MMFSISSKNNFFSYFITYSLFFFHIKTILSSYPIEHIFRICFTTFSQNIFSHKKTTNIKFVVFKEAPTRFELVIRVLQTRALPLGHGAINHIDYNKTMNTSQPKFIDSFHHQMTPTGIEPVLPP